MIGAARTENPRWIVAALGLITLQATLSASATAQSPDVAFHDIEWYVHDSLLSSNPLSFYQDLIEQASERCRDHPDGR
jgi:hypothetical protein